MYVFPKKCEGDDTLKFIFPSKQKAVQKAIDIARDDERINRLIVFGSAVTLDCGMTSDVDIAIDAPNLDFDTFANLARPFYRDIPSEVDIIHYNEIHSELFKQQVNKGVCVYVK